MLTEVEVEQNESGAYVILLNGEEILIPEEKAKKIFGIAFEEVDGKFLVKVQGKSYKVSKKAFDLLKQADPYNSMVRYTGKNTADIFIEAWLDDGIHKYEESYAPITRKLGEALTKVGYSWGT